MEVRSIDKEIEKKEEEIDEFKAEMQVKSKEYFAGIAFVSFQTVEMKRLVLFRNPHTTMEQIIAFFNKGRSKNLKSDDLNWND